MNDSLNPEFWEAGVDRLLACLNPWLERGWQTQLVAGTGEPLYCPTLQAGQPHRIYFAHGYFNSALHELAHWCLAGPERRRREDYGYWYCPDGRDARRQAEFERVEIKPQALEWWFSLASGRSFRTSLDNLSGAATDSRPFRLDVRRQARRYARQGLPARADAAVGLLCREFHRPCPRDRDFADLPA